MITSLLRVTSVPGKHDCSVFQANSPVWVMRKSSLDAIVLAIRQHFFTF